LVTHPITKLVLLFCSFLPAVRVYAQNELFTAASTNDKAQVERLISLGQQVNAKLNGTTPLMMAARNGHTEVIKVLLDNNALIDMTDNTGNTALILATLSRRVSAVRLLLTRSADMEKKNKIGLSAMDVARMKGYTDIEQILDSFKSPEG